ncbi:MAG: T9SS type A sorting domain-containing protein [Ignavibacteria bacterium]|nr:T9SS type A sorting domain-containing protein [Ignavibacteria bacterium]
MDKEKSKIKLDENGIVTNGVIYNGPPMQLEPMSRDNYGLFTRGPEVMVLTGYYDWQTNGDCKKNIGYVSPSIMHAMYMVSLDSTQISPSRRTKYAFSNDHGATWGDLGVIPSIRSGFPSMTVGTTGASQDVAIIGNHYQPGAQLTSGVHVDVSAGAGSFNSTLWNFNQTNFIWPQMNTLSNGNVMVAAETYQGAAATDSGIVNVFNPNTGSWVGNPKILNSPATSQLSMRWTSAAGPGGRALYVISAISDAGSSVGNNRIFYFTSTDNGNTWSTANVLFSSFIDPTGDTVEAWLGLDAVYDNAGNFYVVFNTIADSFQTAKIWVSKNAGTPSLVAANLEIPGSAKSLTSSMGNVITMDWPSVSVSQDGNYVFVAFSVLKQADVVNNFQAFDVHMRYALTSNMTFNAPLMQITQGTNDERYVALNRVTPIFGGYYRIHMTYQKDPQPGSSAFNDNAPVSSASLIYRYIVMDSLIGIINIGNEIPREYSLEQNYPNPFNPLTKIRFNLPKAENVTLTVYNSLGQLVATLVQNEFVSAGVKEVSFDASDLPSGVYLYRIKAGDFTDTRKMILVK